MNVLVKGELILFGTVGNGLFEEGFTAMDVVTALAEHGRSKDITVRVNSGGGIATEGLAIFNALESHRGKVTVVIESIAASAASIIAMAGEEVVMKTGAVMMVHDPAGFTMGNSSDHAKSIEALETLAAAMADIYAEKTGRAVDEVRGEMKAETWMTAQEAVDKGYADTIQKQRGRSKEPTAFDYRLYQHAPERMVALAEARGWKSRDQVADIAADNTTEIEMTEAEKAAAEKAAADKIVADKAAADATAKAEADAKVVADAGVKGERERATQIVAACEIAGASAMAAAFIASDKQVGQVLVELNTLRAEGKLKPTTEISAHHNTGEPDKAKSWAKVTDMVNRRRGHAA